MRRSSRPAQRLSADTRGATAVEYGLILAGIVLALLGGLQALGGSTGGLWNGINTKVLAAH